ncbi:MAG: cellulase family glycosylhydrolase [candidate division KSB1 bacterium]|nr:cellulase family glycosylhydrolase [candidate division KSB1 bacterium]
MKKTFLSTTGNTFMYNDAPVRLRGFGLGNYLNLEHFMFGFPGTDAQIREAIVHAFGKKRAQAFWDHYYTCYTDEADLGFVATLGLNTVRVPVNHHLFSGSFEKSVGVREIDRLLKFCEQHRIWAILDMHTAPGGQNPDWHSDNPNGEDRFWGDEPAQTEMVELWQKIADYYSDAQWIGGYDVLNEPCYFNHEYDEVMLRFYSQCTDSIRQVDSNHILFYEGNVYARDFSMFRSNPDENCSYSFHLYPFLQIPDDLDATDLRKPIEMSLARDVTLAHLRDLNKPLFCGETGHPQHLPNHFDALAGFLDVLEEQAISWALWPLKDCGSMGVINPPENGKWAHLMQDLTGGWNFWDLFSKDSILASDDMENRYRFYKQLIAETTKAHETFAVNLSQTDFKEWDDAVDEFAFSRAQLYEPLVLLVNEHMTKHRRSI